jgi:flavin-dependent dehydrogenase
MTASVESPSARAGVAPRELQLADGARVAVIGGGPAGSFFAYFLLQLAETLGKEFEVDLYEPRDFGKLAPGGCNMCGGIISETLVQNLATEGIHLPSTVVQRGIDSYVLHTDQGSVRIEPPLQEKRIGAVYRGSGPRDTKVRKWASFDGHLQQIAAERGARVVRARVSEVEHTDDGRLRVTARGEDPRTYDLLAVAAGVNAGALKIFEQAGIGYAAPGTTKTFIREYYFGEEGVAECVGSSMHVFLLNIPRLEFAAIIPKGDYVSVCLLGDEIDDELVKAFLDAPEVKGCFPPGWQAEARSCQCSPRISISPASHPYADRIVFVGDCAVTRLYKDGIGAAYRTAKAAARTAVFEGVSAQAFERHYGPMCRSIRNDNRIGKITFLVTRVIQKLRLARRGVVRMTRGEQQNGKQPRMSGVLWDLFTGSASYGDVFLRTLHPFFLGRLAGNVVASLFGTGRKGGEADEQR